MFDACSVGANQPAVIDRHYRCDPVVLQAGGGGGEIAAYVVGVEYGKTTKRTGEQAIAAHAEGVDVVVYQSLEGVEAVRAGRIHEGEAGGGGDGHASAIKSYVGYMFGDEACALAHHVALAAIGVKDCQAIRRGHVNGVVSGVGHNAVDAVDVTILYMRGTIEVG